MKLPLWPNGKLEIIDEDGAHVAIFTSTAARDYIIKTINNYEELANELKDLRIVIRSSIYGKPEKQ